MNPFDLSEAAELLNGDQIGVLLKLERWLKDASILEGQIKETRAAISEVINSDLPNDLLALIQRLELLNSWRSHLAVIEEMQATLFEKIQDVVKHFEFSPAVLQKIRVDGNL